jgi:hypothetical protein
MKEMMIKMEQEVMKPIKDEEIKVEEYEEV